MSDMNTSQSGGSSTSNDQLLGALSYPVALIGVIVLISDSMKNRQPLRTHAVQSIALNVVLLVVTFVLGLIPIVGCIAPLVWLGATIYYAIQAYQGKDVVIPFITDFCKNQKWI